MRNIKNHHNGNKPNGPIKGTFKPGSKKRENKYIVSFDDQDRQEFLTGFHKRKVERRKVALADIRKKIKEEQIRVREERHKEYIKMLKERTDALAEIEDDLEDTITSTTESVQFDHPNHTVTVTTISDLDLSGAHLLGPASNQVNGAGEGEEKGEEEREQTSSMPRKAGNPIMNKKIRTLNASLSTLTSKRRPKGKGKGKQEDEGGQGHQKDKKSGATKKRKKQKGKTGKWQRRRQTGKKCHYQD